MDNAIEGTLLDEWFSDVDLNDVNPSGFGMINQRRFDHTQHFLGLEGVTYTKIFELLRHGWMDSKGKKTWS